MPLFSIIIPVHNSEKSLHRCLDSLLNQTEQDFEVLMAENGSSDHSVSICQEYCMRDIRFHLTSLGPCNGPSTGRNRGLDQAIGTYITFIDSDDYVSSQYLEQLNIAFESADVVFMGFRQVDESGKVLSIGLPEIKIGSSFYETITSLNRQDLFGYTWIKAFRRSVIGSIRFQEELNLMEDEVFTCQVLSPTHRICVLTEPLYNYVTGNSGSLMGRTHPDFCLKCNTVFHAWTDLLADWDGADAFLDELAQRFTERCRFYGFERSVPFGSFFKELAKSDYFSRCSQTESFYQAVRNQNILFLRWQKAVYHCKNALHRFFKKT